METPNTGRIALKAQNVERRALATQNLGRRALETQNIENTSYRIHPTYMKFFHSY